jgi:hypothetical protein
VVLGGPFRRRSRAGVLLVAESAKHFLRVPGPWPGTSNLGGGAKPATLDGLVAKRSARELVQVAGAGPTDVAAPAALAGLEMAVHMREDSAPGTAAETFEGVRGHHV